MSDDVRNKRVRIKDQPPVPTVLRGKEGVIYTGREGPTDDPWVSVLVGTARYMLRLSELEVIGDATP